MKPDDPGYPAARLSSRVLFYLALLASAFVGVRLHRATAAFEEIFADLGAELPLITQILLDFPAGWVCLGLAAASTAKEHLVRNPRVTIPMNGVHLALLIVLNEVWLEAMFQPLLSLIENLG